VEEAWAGSWISGVRGEEEEMRRSVDFWVDGRS